MRELSRMGEGRGPKSGTQEKYQQEGTRRTFFFHSLLAQGRPI
jgi:hypothetical protein